MLTNSNKKYRDVCRVNKTNKSADHVTNSVTLGDDEAIKCANSTKSSVEIACLSD